jgi:hypothetical protein
MGVITLTSRPDADRKVASPIRVIVSLHLHANRYGATFSCQKFVRYRSCVIRLQGWQIVVGEAAVHRDEGALQTLMVTVDSVTTVSIKR